MRYVALVMLMAVLLVGCTPEQKDQAAANIAAGTQVLEVVAPFSGTFAPWIYGIITIGSAISGLFLARQKDQKEKLVRNALETLSRTLDKAKHTNNVAPAMETVCKYLEEARHVAGATDKRALELVEAIRKGLK